MTALVLALLVIGCGFLIAELFIPGFGIFGILGIIMVVCSAVLTIMIYPFGLYIMLGEVVLIGFAVYSLATYIKRKQLHGKIILDETLDMEAREIADYDYFLGKQGITKTSLRPFGKADFNGVTVGVYSDGAYIQENTQIKVTEVVNDKVIVTRLNTNN